MRRDQNIISIEKPIESVEEYIKRIDMLIEKNASKERIFAFRGEPQKHSTFCQPNIFRKNVLSTNKFYEKSLFNTMRQNKLSNSNSYLENAIDAQHGEFPSRLLDVSYNCLDALYFAVTPYYHKDADSLDSKDGMVYIFYIDEIFSPSAQNTNDNYNAIINKDQSWFNGQFIFEKNHKFIDHTKINNRIIAQQGAFILFQGDSPEEIPAYMMNGIVIAHDAKAKIRRDLSRMFGINTGTIYPEIMNFADDLINKSKILITDEFSWENEINYVLKNLKKELSYYFDYLISFGKENDSAEFYESVQYIEQTVNSYRTGLIKFYNDRNNLKIDIKETLLEEKFSGIINEYNAIVKDFADAVQMLSSTTISKDLYIDNVGGSKK
ncbi:MAG: FRG domain-containing protein [Clostridia bacterium]|nr:FRG domain-containing protein [Clostridia bacterium]